VDVDDGAEILDAHLGEALVAQDAGIVDQDMDAAPVLLRLGATIASTCSASVTLAPFAIASPPAASISSTTFAARRPEPCGPAEPSRASRRDR
jgi:hypothetical protein